MSKYIQKSDRSISADVVGTLRTDRLLLTDHDATRLWAILEQVGSVPIAAPTAKAHELLAIAMQSAVVVPPERIPSDVVTMRSRLVLKDVESGGRREVALVYPEEERAHDGQISVVTPIGAALLGLSEGALVKWRHSSGRTTVLRVESVRYQPEAAEEFHL
jgi:regulator of nucleoside diphosphate kinase